MAQIQFRSDDTTTWAPRFGDGSDGALTISLDTTDAVANTSCSGNLSSNTLTVGSATGFSNNDLVLIHQTRNGGDTAGDWMLNKISSGEGTTTWTMTYALSKNFATTAQVYLLNQYSSVTIDSTKTLTARAWNGSSGGILALLCNGTTAINGTLNLVAKGYRGGIGTAGVEGYQGEGTAGAGSSGVNTANGNGSGTGGYQPGGGALGDGGGTSGDAALTIATFGGGSGGVNESRAGKIGGGFLLIIAPTITVDNGTGTIDVDGTDGETGNNPADTAPTGGSAGGSALFKGVTISLGTNRVTAIAGASSSNGSSNTRGSGGGGHAASGSAGGTGTGGAGSAGRIHADYQGSISGTTTPTLDSRQDTSLSTSTSTSTTSTSSSTSTSRTTSTSTTVSVTTSTSTTSTSRSTSTTTTSTSTTSTSTSTTSTSTTIDLTFSIELI